MHKTTLQNLIPVPLALDYVAECATVAAPAVAAVTTSPLLMLPARLLENDVAHNIHSTLSTASTCGIATADVRYTRPIRHVERATPWVKPLEPSLPPKLSQPARRSQDGNSLTPFIPPSCPYKFFSTAPLKDSGFCPSSPDQGKLSRLVERRVAKLIGVT